MAILKTGTNVFLTGEPGSGKTYAVNLYVQYLRDQGVGVAVTATTGIAATHLGGMTIHSWSGIGIKKVLSESDIIKLCGKHHLTSRARKTYVLIIDEISMLDAKTLDVVNKGAQILRESGKPFGGMQVVFVGDFFQLPPVVRDEESFSGFAFESLSWNKANPVVCYLTEQHRQEDAKFINILSSIRKRERIEDVYRFLSSRKMEIKFKELVTRLYSHNVDVDRVNSEKLKNLHGEEYVFYMTSQGAKPLVEQLKKSCLSPEILTLKKGAKVMFTKNNFEEGFVNGTLGEVVGFDNEIPIIYTGSGREIVVEPVEWEINDGLKTLASITQIPLRLAWAITVHKSQGMTLDEVVVDLTQAFEYGQGYVALSRVRTLSGLFLLGLNKKALEVHPDISQADATFRLKSEKARYKLLQYSWLKLREEQKDFIIKSGGSLTKAIPKSEISTYDQTLEMYNTGKDVSEIANIRSLKERTIIGHLEKLKAEGKLKVKDLERLVSYNFKKVSSRIQCMFYKLNTTKLSPVFEKFGGRYSYDELQIARLLLKEVPTHTVSTELKQSFFEKIREMHTNAYLPWSEEEDEKLRKLFSNSSSVKDLAQTFNRSKGAIRSRLTKLGLLT